jgi:hypothetical protein
MEDNIEIDDWIVPLGTGSVQQVKDIDVIDGKRIFYTHSGLAYTIDQIEPEDDDDDDWEYMDDEIKNILLSGISAN